MQNIQIRELKSFCTAALLKEGMNQKNAEICGEVLSETDAFGTYSHGTKNLYNYVKKNRAGGVDFQAVPQIEQEGPSYALIDANNAMGMISSCMAMEIACEKAGKMGIAIVTVKNSCHFGAAGYYSNIACKHGMIGLAMSNVDPNMTAPGARGMLLGNNPLSFAAPSQSNPSIFLDIAVSNVASLKVVQARKDGKSIPDTWIVDKEGLPTTDPSHYPEEGAMQPMAAHKGYGLAILVELLTGVLSGGGMSMMGDIVSWCFHMEQPNNVCHTFIAIDPTKFIGSQAPVRMDAMAKKLHDAPKAKGAEHIYVPGEIEWERYRAAVKKGISLPPDVYNSLKELSLDCGIELPVTEEQ